MGLFSRVKDLLEANITDLVKKAEDPEKMLNLYVDRATEEVRNFQIQVNRAVADKILLEEKIEELNKQVAQRTEQATLAVKQGKDDLARTALSLKKEAESSLVDYQGQLANQSQAVQDLQENLKILMEKLEKAKLERNNLVMRQRRAETMKKANDAISGLSSRDPLADIDRMKDKVENMEAEAKASKIMTSSANTLDDQFADLKKSQASQEVEDELAKLKAELNQGK